MKRPSAARVSVTDATDGDLAKRARSQPEERSTGDEDTELEQPVPNAERIVAEAVALAAAKDDPELVQLVARYWRLAPDEELAGCTPEGMVEATRAHREFAAQRLPGELKLRIGT